MSRLSIPELDNAPQASQPILEAVRKQLGVVPNMFRLAANSPAALEGFAANNGALAKALDVKTRERIALAVAQINGCDYCLSAHTYLGSNLAKLTPEEIDLNRRGRSHDAKADAAVRFASKLVLDRGSVTDHDVASLRAAGYGDKEIVEIIAVTAENIFTNYLNIVGGTELDFPAVRANDLAEAA
ncbi:peroxidase-related enzyme [Maricaulis sp.]|uniref:carboxymuconolactone decarboxylase family protein n=1 Tax=Maricaulis sp. TaxID=1486257 RepID=UPI0026071DF3|nr:peroxidase-related enzyme [Maricaulis sp.]